MDYIADQGVADQGVVTVVDPMAFMTIDPMAFMTTQEVAVTMRTSPETVRYWRHVGRGPASFKVGRRVLYARTDVQAWIAKARGDALTKS